MKPNISSRHEGDVGGILSPFGETKRVRITVAVAAETAHLASVQHTAWMLVNLLCRCDGIVESVGLLCPKEVVVSGKVVPLAADHEKLSAALLAGGLAIGVVPILEGKKFERVIHVGPGGGTGIHLHVWGSGWCGGISKEPLDRAAFGEQSRLPFGPYVAACLCAGEVFKEARIIEEDYASTRSVFYSLWEHEVGEAQRNSGPASIDAQLDALLVGVGAVGSAFLHTIWATSGLSGKMALVDNDDQGLEPTNLNRYTLFGIGSVGVKKASAAAKLLAGTAIGYEAHDCGIESLEKVAPRVVSAVDKNSARHAIQVRYPSRIFSASTLNLRAETLRCGPPGVGACLACYNPEEKIVADDDVREKLKEAAESILEKLAAAKGITVADVKEWMSTPRCGSLGERILPLLRPADGPAAFAVGFVSVMAGTMLAAEFVKDHLPDVHVLSDAKQRAVFQFLNPLAPTNRASPLMREPTCAKCDPASLKSKIWSGRYYKTAARN